MLRSSIPVDPLALPYAERCIRNARRAFVVFAVVALTISTLDLMSVPLLKAAGAYLHEDQQRREAVLLSSPLVAIAQNPALKSLPMQLASYNPGALPALSGVRPLLRRTRAVRDSLHRQFVTQHLLWKRRQIERPKWVARTLN